MNRLSEIKDLENLIEYIKTNSIKAIGIAGASGSGKTSLALKMKEMLGSENCLVLHVDDYWKYDRGSMKRLGLTGYDWGSRNKDVFLKDLESLLQNKKIDKPIFDYQNELPTNKTEVVFPKKFIILEATLDFSEMTDLNIFTFASEKVLIKRRLERDKGLTSFKSLSEMENYIRNTSLPVYKKKLLPLMKTADFVFNSEKNQLINNSNI